MKKKKGKEGMELILIDWLFYRMRLLDVERQNYEQNTALTQNIKAANIEIIQNDIEGLKKILRKIMTASSLGED